MYIKITVVKRTPFIYNLILQHFLMTVDDKKFLIKRIYYITRGFNYQYLIYDETRKIQILRTITLIQLQ